MVLLGIFRICGFGPLHPRAYQLVAAQAPHCGHSILCRGSRLLGMELLVEGSAGSDDGHTRTIEATLMNAIKVALTIPMGCDYVWFLLVT